jgi:hypothetical protein
MKIPKINDVKGLFSPNRKIYRFNCSRVTHTSHPDRGTMDQNMTVLLERMKKGVVQRCKERVIEAAEKKKIAIPEPDLNRPPPGISSLMKKARGL